ncbi:uncharacterized protein LOC125953648 [Anopheles darlingi]|uniref:uncharacterized protein LOC125953648 n=1 Tax=Anopheles darlingi TaxID=43151 RepID=UPI0020FFF78A|nr:uncharacterized protein LOC125953648 [Anopheles darlingi]
MEEEEADQLQPAVLLRAPSDKWFFNMSGGAAAGASPFGPSDSGYNSYQSVTPNNTFNGSCSRHGASSTLAPIDEANETDTSMNDSSTGLPLSAQVLTPTTAANIDRISNFHLTTPKTRRLPFAGDSGGAGMEDPLGSVEFTLPTTPERASFPRSQSFEAYQTPLRTVNRTLNQLTPHKAKGSGRDSLKRKLPSSGNFRGKLHSDSDVDALLGEENQENDPTDSLVAGCRRLSDDLPSPIPRSKRQKRHEDNNITDMMRSSTPKTACYLGDENHHGNGAVLPSKADGKPLFRKFTSFSPRKIQNIRRLGTGGGGGGMLMRQNAFSAVQVTPEKRSKKVDQQTSKVLADISSSPRSSFGQLEKEEEKADEAPGGNQASVQAPIGIGDLLGGAILTESCSNSSKEASASALLEDAMTTVSSNDDCCSFTPTKSFASEDEDGMVERHAPAANQQTMLASILEEPSNGILPALECEPQSKCNLTSPLEHQATLPSTLEEPSYVVLPALGTPPQPVEPLELQYNPVSPLNSSSNVEHLRTGGNYSNGYFIARPPLPRSELRAGPSPTVNQCSATSASSGRKRSYEGQKYLDILRRLASANHDALGLLLDCLADEDLVQVVRVSRSWHSIIYGHPKSCVRLQKQLNREAKHKENRYGPACGASALDTKLKPKQGTTELDAVSKVLFPSVSSEETAPQNATEGRPPAAEVQCRRPFKPCNFQDRRNSTSSLYGGVSSFGIVGGNVSMPELLRRRSSVNTNNSTTVESHSPPVSPSKRKFYDNQKVVSHLKESERLTPCPRCKKPSRIIYGRRSGRANGARLEKSYTLPESNNNSNSPARVRRDLFNTSGGNQANARMRLRSMNGGGRTKSVDDALTMAAAETVADGVAGGGTRDRDSLCDYAICSGMRCGYQFCIQCCGEPHPDRFCLELAPNSPSKEEQGRPNVACTRQSRRSLQRLAKY